MNRQWWLALCGVGIVAGLFAEFAAAADPAVTAAVARHTEMLAKITSYHLKIESHHSREERPGEPLVHGSDYEVWSSGARHRSLNRVFLSLGQEGWIDHGPNGRVWESSVNGREARSLGGWDPERPFELPLDPEQNEEHAAVHGSIQSWDPKQLPSRKIVEASAMHWQLRMDMPLARLAELCEVAIVPQPDTSITRLKFVASKAPETAAPELRIVGSVLDLDHKHGWQVCRIETPYQETVVITQVLEFREGAPGLWYPVETRSTVGKDIVDVVKVLKCEFNQPIDDVLLETQFPAGARLNDRRGD